MKIEDEDLEHLLSKVKKLESSKSTIFKSLNLGPEELSSTLKQYEQKDKLGKSV